MQINWGILGIGVRRLSGAGSARSWRLLVKGKISGKAQQTLRGKVGAPQGTNPEATKTAGLACTFLAPSLPNRRSSSGLLCIWPSARLGREGRFPKVRDALRELGRTRKASWRR